MGSHLDARVAREGTSRQVSREVTVQQASQTCEVLKPWVLSNQFKTHSKKQERCGKEPAEGRNLFPNSLVMQRSCARPSWLQQPSPLWEVRRTRVEAQETEGTWGWLSTLAF